jgi:hypothetical protein
MPKYADVDVCLCACMHTYFGSPTTLSDSLGAEWGHTVGLESIVGQKYFENLDAIF